jgi:hypothetical protein
VRECRGGEGDLDPTARALAELAAEVRDCLEEEFRVLKVEAPAAFDELLGVETDPDG